MMEAGKLHAELSQFIGCVTPTRHSLCKSVFMSEGIIYLREHADCHWLIDAITSHYSANRELQKERRRNQNFDYLHFWVLSKQGNGAILTCREDRGMPDIVTQEIEFTDFPFPSEGEFKLYGGLTAIDRETRPTMIFLPSEY